jgi:acetyl esterase/lipase
MPTLSYRLVEALVRLSGLKRVFAADEQTMRARLARDAPRRRPTIPRGIRRQSLKGTVTLDNRPCYILGDKDSGAREAVLFLHGGGQIIEASFIHWSAAARLMRQTQAEICMAAYPLAPFATYVQAAGFCFDCYKRMLEDHSPRRITLLGDSAGAALAASLCHMSKRENRPMPGRLILVSPGEMVNLRPEVMAEMERIGRTDPMLAVSGTLGLAAILGLSPEEEAIFRNPFTSDVSGFPPTDLFCGTNEIFYALLPYISKNFQRRGVSLDIHKGEGMMHIWPYLPIARESRAALLEIANIIQTHDSRAKES